MTDRTLPTHQPTDHPPPNQESLSSQHDDSEAGGLAGGGDFAWGWGKVANRLTTLGASRWRESIAEAKQCGCTPGLALTLIDYGTSKGYGVGAIICRLVKARPTLPVDAGWPPPETAAQVTEKVARTESDRKEKERREEREQQERLARERAQMALLESRFGVALDAMDEESFASLVESTPKLVSARDTLKPLLKKRPVSGFVREMLLGTLAIQEGGA